MPLEDFCALDEMNAFWLPMVMDDTISDELDKWFALLEWFIPVMSALLGPLGSVSRGVSFLFLPFPFCTGVFLPPRYL